MIIKRLMVGLSLLCGSALAHETIGVSMGSDVEDDDAQTSLFEINYEAKSSFISGYIGYTWLDVPAAFDSSIF